MAAARWRWCAMHDGLGRYPNVLYIGQVKLMKVTYGQLYFYLYRYTGVEEEDVIYGITLL
jgi:hypothetical protein